MFHCLYLRAYMNIIREQKRSSVISVRKQQHSTSTSNNNRVMIFSISHCLPSCFPEILSIITKMQNMNLKVDRSRIFTMCIWHFLDYYHMNTLLLFRLAQALHNTTRLKCFFLCCCQSDRQLMIVKWLIDWLIISVLQCVRSRNHRCLLNVKWMRYVMHKITSKEEDENDQIRIHHVNK